MLGMGHELLEAPRLKPFEVKVTYDGQKKGEQFLIDISQFEGLIRLGKPPEEGIAAGVTQIAKVLDSWSRNRLLVEAISTPEKERRDKERYRQMQERRAPGKGRQSDGDRDETEQ